MRSEIKRYKFKEDEIDQFQLINLNKYKIRDIIKSQQKLDFNEMLQYLVQYIKESVSEIVQDLNALIQIFLNKHISKQSLHQLFSQIISTYQDKGEKQNKLQLCIFEEITNSLQQLLTIEQLSDLQKFIESIQQHKNDIKFLQKENDQHFFLNYLSTRVLRQVFNKKKDEFKLPSSLICEDIGESIQFACSVKIMREEETSTIEGQYDADGRKVGIWRELFKNYQEDQQIIYVGQYSMSKKLGRWNILADHYIIGGGEYDKNGQKVGLWVEISEKFNRFCKIIYVGDYQNGLKFGQWNTLENDHTIESGAYDGQGRKVGSWIELDPNYNEKYKIVMKGDYVNNKKIGKWLMVYKNQIVGGGLYSSWGQKTSKWIECHLQFNEDCQIIATGEYENGNRVGVWEYQNNSLVVGGGTYNKNGLKQGQWLEPQEEDNIDVVYFRGNYKDGKRVDQWNIFNTDNCVIGGGYYDINGNKCKLWTDFFNLSSVKFIGKYQNSRKIGLWKSIKFEQLAKDTIFGGCFNKNEQKIGLWNELIENYSETCKLSFQGLYLNGKKILRWDTIYDNKKIGGGRYDLRGNKVGKWIEQIKDFSNKCQVLYFGEYSYGCKIGIWGVQYAQNRSFNLKVIGQGQYNSKSQKSGKWLEIDQNFNKFNINFKNKLVFAQFLIEGIIKMDIKSGHGSVLQNEEFYLDFVIIFDKGL